LKKTLISLLVIAAFMMTCMGVAQAAQDSLDITVTISSISISVGDDWDIGIMDLDDTKATTGGQFTVTNSGTSNTPVDLDIIGGDSTSGTPNWTIQPSNGPDEFVLECQGGLLTSWTSLHSSQNLQNNVGIGGSATFDLQLTTPISDSSSADLQTIPVTVTASIAGS